MATPKAGIFTECTSFNYYEERDVLAAKDTANVLVASAFSCDPTCFDLMLQCAYGTQDDDLHNQPIHYITPVLRTQWFAPCEKDLAAIGCAG